MLDTDGVLLTYFFKTELKFNIIIVYNYNFN